MNLDASVIHRHHLWTFIPAFGQSQPREQKPSDGRGAVPQAPVIPQKEVIVLTSLLLHSYLPFQMG